MTFLKTLFIYFQVLKLYTTNATEACPEIKDKEKFSHKLRGFCLIFKEAAKRGIFVVTRMLLCFGNLKCDKIAITQIMNEYFQLAHTTFTFPCCSKYAILPLKKFEI